MAEPTPDTAQLAQPSGADALDQGPYVDGFSMRTVLGALFVAFVMMPASVYLGLVTGQTLGSAAEWVTIILFAEVARRSFAQLSRQEIYVLFYVASTIAAVTLIQIALAGGPITSTIWNQYLLQGPETQTLAAGMPDWVVPPVDSPAIQERDLFHKDWWWSATTGFLSPIMLIVVGFLLGRLSWLGLGYLLFRLTSDVERLPFPLAPIAAEGSTALAESTDREPGVSLAEARKTSWRWRVFSTGAVIGILFGAVYVGLPMVTTLITGTPLMVFPIPFVDLTTTFEGILPAGLISISFDMGLFFVGMILPFRLILGMFAAACACNFVINPLLFHYGVFENFRRGNGLLVNQLVLTFDFYLSVVIGLSLAVAIVGVWGMLRVFAARARARAKGASVSAATAETIQEAAPPPPPRAPSEPPHRTASKERGDYPIWVAVLLFVAATGGYATICHVLVPAFPMWIILAFGFFWTPLQSYISARLVGITGQPLNVPFVRETVFLTSGYKGLDIWFAPIPLVDYGPTAQKFREMELTRTKFTSIIKAEFLIFPIVFLSSLVFWWFFWMLNQIPSPSFPFAARMWPIAARQTEIIFTANANAEESLLLNALEPALIAGSAIGGLLLYGVLWFFGLPVLFFYGMIGGVGQPLHPSLLLVIGALAGRYYFRRKFGEERWGRYAPVVTAGFMCGMGLAAMIAVAFTIIVQSTKDLPF